MAEDVILIEVANVGVQGPPGVQGDPGSSYLEAILRDNPLHYWRLNERTGLVARDSAASGNDGLIRNGVTLGASSPMADGTPAMTFAAPPPGQPGGIAPLLSVAVPAAFTIEGWIKSTVAAYQALWSSRTLAGLAGELFLGITDTGRVAALTTGGASHIGVAPIGDGQWHHVAVTFDGTTARSYVDGVLDQTTAHARSARTAQGLIGFDAANAGVAWRGDLDEIVIYPQALTPTQIAAHYAVGLEGVTPHAPTHQPGGSDPITALSADVLTTGTVPDARLSANVPRLDAPVNQFAGELHSLSALVVRRAVAPHIVFREEAQGLDQKNWLLLGNLGRLQFNTYTDASNYIATAFEMDRAGNVNILGRLSSSYVLMTERAAPAAPVANQAHVWLEDNGAGKSRLMIRFATGAAIQIAIEP